MPSFTGKAFANFYKNILGIDQAANTGLDTVSRTVQDGNGNNSAIALSDDVLQVLPQNDTGTATFSVRNKGGDAILAVDTGASLVKAGASQVNTLTLFKEMGLYDFSPTAGYHNPLIANNMMQSDSGEDIIEDQSMFSNGTDPAATLDLSANGTPMIAIACYWYLENNITLDAVRYATATDGSDSLEFHLESYTLDTSTNFGDLSAGTTCASVHSVTSDATSYRTGTLSLDSADIDAGKVVIGFVESDSTTDISCTLNIKYHIR
tara:strand:+ start:260 stop:1051 length:792 start_codon:yes stop_codon:yes gene_type:complete